MESRRSEQTPEPDERIDSLINEYFERRQSGEDLSPERFAAEHPDSAEQLSPYLRGLLLLDRIRPVTGDMKIPAITGYELLEEIGRGGMGVAYKALQVSTKRIVALKVMLGGAFASQSTRRRFEREVELAARLQHASIVRVLESGDVAGQRYYAMDYVAGIRLDRYLAATQPDLRTTLGILQRICEAVDFAHRHGVIHRDLKPANVLIDQEGNPHILDFGLAKATDQAETEEALTTSVSFAGQVLGTLFYLSPEQAAGTPDQIDPRTDVYALGVLLFEALTGSLPFDTAGRPSQVIQRILEIPPTSPSSLSDQVDGELETIILEALEKDKARRYQSAKEMAEDIGRYLQGEPILAKRPSTLYFLRKKVLKHRRAAVLGAAVVILGLVGLWAESRSRQRELAQARRVALSCQQQVERQWVGPTLGQASALYEQYPELPEAILVWAQAQYHDEETRSHAIQFLEKELERDPSQWACRALLAEIHRATSDVERADALQARVERDAPDTAQAWYLRSLATLDLQRALRCAHQAVQRSPQGEYRALAWDRLAHLRLQTGDLDGALQGADKLMELGQEPGKWTVFKGQVLARQGRFAEAVEQFTQVISTPAGEAASNWIQTAYKYRAHAYRRLKEYAQAVADYTKVVEIAAGRKGTVVWDLYQRATPLWILGRTDEALDDYHRVGIMLGEPFYSDARSFLILHQQGRQREAKEVIQSALRKVQDPWRRQIFRCLAGQLTPDELVADAEARDNREWLCEAYYYAGEVCLLSDRLAEARTWFERCVRTGHEFDLDTAPATPMNEYELAQWRLESLPLSAATSRPQEN